MVVVWCCGWSVVNLLIYGTLNVYIFALELDDVGCSEYLNEMPSPYIDNVNMFRHAS